MPIRLCGPGAAFHTKSAPGDSRAYPKSGGNIAPRQTRSIAQLLCNDPRVNRSHSCVTYKNLIFFV
ncbi:hypothetical protein L539_2454 [Bordetella hinzii 5132]|uniref:Uncharacterized protein n=1 Tax=Bordetella hinzii OH87 BAL007II TaxID=1331262 RepID=A0ABR4R113_9BORD|nr:hypothetical protein L544_2144 [Bordetella hinzii OH87 BAL007II]KCB40548.1 hypothetical protein L539_2454 [Bordetella hinzii 5132]